MRPLPPLGRGGLIGRGMAGGAVALCTGAFLVSALGALKSMKAEPGSGFDLMAELASLASPSDVSGWMQVGGVLVFGLFAGLCTAAVFAARHGAGSEVADH